MAMKPMNGVRVTDPAHQVYLLLCKGFTIAPILFRLKRAVTSASRSSTATSGSKWRARTPTPPSPGFEPTSKAARPAARSTRACELSLPASARRKSAAFTDT
jgi:hypothetical protein